MESIPSHLTQHTVPTNPFANQLVFLPNESVWPIPDWDAIAESEPTDAIDEFWTAMGGYWVDYVSAYLGHPYETYESKSFLLVSGRGKRESASIIRWLEEIQLKVANYLGPLLQQELYGKCPVFLFENDDEYYTYISHYYDEGEYGNSGGIYINRGYGHFALPFNEYVSVKPAMAHELTHALVRSANMPLWLNEGIAQLCEEAVTGHLTFDYDTVKEHIGDYWNSETIQAYWTGRSFQRADHGQVLSYHLAQAMTYRLMTNRSQFDAFALKATASDAGESALLEVFDTSLQTLVSSVLGEDNWTFRKEMHSNEPQ